MTQTLASAHKRLEYLSQALPELRPASTLRTNVLREAHDIQFWLGQQKFSLPLNTGLKAKQFANVL